MIKTVYLKYIKTIARVGYAPPDWKRAQGQGLKESRITIRGDEDNGLSRGGGGLHIVPTALLVRVLCEEDTIEEITCI